MQFIAKKASVNNRFEKLLMGEIDTLIQDGVLQVDSMLTTRITREKLFANLRGSSIKQLGEVQRCYFESTGDFFIIKAKEPKPGLSVLPDWDKKFRDKQKLVADISVCKTCGNIKLLAKENGTPCNKCGSTETEPAVV